MELRHLRYFLAVAEELHFRRAAERLHISQPPLSLQIADLERELGVKLFDRTNQRVSLTPSGRVFLDYTRQIMATLSDARRDVQLAGSGERGAIRIAFTQSAEFLDILPEAIRLNRLAAPDVTFTLRQMASADQVSAICNRELDLGISRKPSGPLPKTVELVWLRDDPIVLAIHRDHPLATRTMIDFREARDLGFVAHAADGASGLHGIMMALCRRARFTPEIVQEAREMPTILGLVAARVGAALVPRSACKVGIHPLAFIDVTNDEARSALFMIMARDARSQIVEAFSRRLLKIA